MRVYARDFRNSRNRNNTMRLPLNAVSMVGSGDRSKRFALNLKENRVTDHRIGSPFIVGPGMEGSIDEIIQALITHDQARN